MTLTSSTYEKLVRLKARYLIQRDPARTLVELERRYSRGKSARNKLRVLYNYDPDAHFALFNKHRAHKSAGCGCALCVALFKYSKLRLEKHYFKTTFESEGNLDAFHPATGRLLPVVFSNEYFLHVKECTNSGNNALSEIGFYEERMALYNRKIKELKVHYKSIEDSINSLMSK